MDTYTYRQIGDWLRQQAQIPPHLRGYRILQRLIMDVIAEPDIIFRHQLDAHCHQLDAALGYHKRGAQSAAQRAIYQAHPRYSDMGLAQFLATAAEDFVPSK